MAKWPAFVICQLLKLFFFENLLIWEQTWRFLASHSRPVCAWGLKGQQGLQGQRARGRSCRSTVPTAWVGLWSNRSLLQCLRSAHAVWQAAWMRVCVHVLWDHPAFPTLLGGFGRTLPTQSKIPGWKRLKICFRPSAPVATSLLPWGLFESWIPFPSYRMCWECPAMSGSVSTCDFTSLGVSQASCANQQFIHGLESGCDQDMGRANSYKASIQTCIFCHHCSQTYCSSCCAARETSAAAMHQGLFVCLTVPCFGLAGVWKQFLPLNDLVVHILHSIHLEDVFVCCWGWHRAQDR